MGETAFVTSSSILQILIKFKHSMGYRAIHFSCQLRLAQNHALHSLVVLMTLYNNYNVSVHSTTATVARCNSLEGQLDDSVTISSNDPAVEGTTVTFHCPAGSVSNGPDLSTCMENGEWEPPPYQVNCSG